MAKEVMIQVKNLCKSYGDKQILKNIDAEFHKGDVVAIIGPSGCGKSTFLRMLNLLEKPTSGDILLDGKSILDKNVSKPTIRARVGMVFQQFNLFKNMTALKNVMFAPVKLGRMTKAEGEKQAMELLKRVGLADRADHYPAQLSGGQQQRVAFARAIISNPKLILADEPTGNLDSQNGLEAMNILSELHKEGATIVMVTHNQRDAAYADRIINLFDGRIIEMK